MVYSPDLIRSIARRHGVGGEPTLLPKGGMVNEAWLVGESHVLRMVCIEGCDDEAAREAAVVPLVIEAGLMAPRLTGFDSAGKPRPYTIYERAEGVLLGYAGNDPSQFEPAYYEIGRQIERLGRVAVPVEVMRVLHRGKRGDPRESLERAFDKGVVSSRDAREIELWIERMRPLLGRCRRRVLLHQDIHPWNVFVDPDSKQLTAIIDWGDAAFGDPAFEFASMPLVAVPSMLRGYQDAGGRLDPGFVARILWNGVTLALWEIRELDPDAYDRCWWRFTASGWPEMRDVMERLLSE